MPSETVKVMVRVRPFNEREKNKNCTNITNVDTINMQITLTNPNSKETEKVFTYDSVFSQETPQQTIYEEAAFQLVESVLEGYNGTIFAYGQTGCGKTHTMIGSPDDDSNKGIIPRAFAHIFGNIESTSHKNFLIRCSYIEIYNEEVHDLLSNDIKAKLEMKESSDKGIFIKNLSMHIVKSISDIERLMLAGMKNRSVGETLMNKDSSRSHSVFTIYIEAGETDSKGNQRITLGKLNLVDLAGSERQSKTQATGDRLKEANKINLSLSALGNVISALVDGKSAHVPYRDSKLTRLLQDSLGGNTKTVMIANVSPASDSYDETLGTLRYASRAKNIKNQPKVNQDPKDALLFEYAAEIKRLKMLLENGNYNQNFELSPNQEGTKEQEENLTSNPKRRKLRQTDEEFEEQIKQKDDEILNERKKREELELKLSEMQSQLLVGGNRGNSANGSSEPEEKKKYQEMLRKMKEQKHEHETLLEEKRKKEEEVALVERKYATLQEEVEAQRKIIQTLKKKYKNAVNEIHDLEREHELNKEELLDTIRVLEKDNQINKAIMLYLLSPQELNRLRSAAKWHDERNEFIVPPFILRGKTVNFPKLPQAKALQMITEEWKGRELEIKKNFKGAEYDSDSDCEKKDQREKRRNNSSVFVSSKGFEKTANGTQTNFFKRSRQHNLSTEKNELLHSEAKPIRKLTPSRLSNKNSFENQFVSLKDSVNTALQAVYKMPPRVPIDLFPKKKHPFRNVQLEPLNNKNMNNSLSNISQRGKRDINSSHTEPTSLNTLKTEEVTPMKDHQAYYKQLATIDAAYQN